VLGDEAVVQPVGLGGAFSRSQLFQRGGQAQQGLRVVWQARECGAKVSYRFLNPVQHDQQPTQVALRVTV